MATIFRHLPIALLALAALAAQAHGPGAHEHGAATLEVAVDGDRIELHFESPLDNLLGFERAPRSEAERQAVRAMAQRLHRAGELFVATPQAQCSVASTSLESGVLPAALLAAPGASAPATSPGADADGHADLDANIVLRCAKPQALKGLQLRLFEAFPRLRRIDAQLATGTRQSAARLTPREAALAF